MKMKKMGRLLAMVLAIIMAMALVACGGGDTGGSSTGGGTTGGDVVASDPDRALNVAVSLDSGTLHPLGLSGSGGFQNVLQGVYDRLLDDKTDGTRVWILATGIDYVSDIQYTLHLREGVTYSNGNPFNAEDVMFTMELCAQDARAALNVKAIDLEKTNIIDEYTIDLWYTEYNAAQETGFSQMAIFDKESYDEVALASTTIGTGPYIVTDYVVNSHAYLKYRDDYWGEAPAIKEINFRVLDEEAQRVNALETGDVDMAYIPVKDVDYVESLGYVCRNENPGIALVAMFNMSADGVMGTKEARYAVSHAIDREGISNIVFNGISGIPRLPLSDTLIDLEPRFFDMHETYTIGYDPDLAKQYADESGLTGKTVRIITNGSAEYITIAEIMQSNLTEIGVNSEIINYDQATYFTLLMDESNFDIAIFNPAAPSLMAVDILAMYFTFIPLGWTGPDFDQYMEVGGAAISTYDDKTRGDMIYECLELFVDNDPWFALVEGVSIRVHSSDLQNVQYNMAGSTLFSEMSFSS